jgi:hypothetical protein
MAESALYNSYLLRATERGHRLWITPSAMLWAGQAQQLDGGRVMLTGARRVRVGRDGMSDLNGWTSVTITPEMVGMRLPISTSVEVKVPSGGKQSDKQKDWISMVKMHGGIAGFSRSLDDYDALVTAPLVGALR